MAQPALTLRRWKRVEYDRLVDLGAFHGDPVELIGGHLIVAEPQGTYHAGAVGAIDRVLQLALPPEWIVRCQLPIALDEESEPEPDLAVVPGSHADYFACHPMHPVLVIEVAESSLEFDRQYKGSLYARGDVPDYWIINLVDRLVEVCRDRAVDSAAPYGWRYRSVQSFAPPAVLVPLALPSLRIPADDLLPSRPS